MMSKTIQQKQTVDKNLVQIVLNHLQTIAAISLRYKNNKLL